MDRAFKGPRRHHSFYAKHRRTDHLSFDEVGIPGFQFIQDTLDYDSRTHHSNTDTYERLQAEDLAQAATVEAVFVYNTAMRDQLKIRIHRIRITVRGKV